MTRMMDAWRRRPGPERFETYTRWTLYFLLGVLPVMGLTVLAGATAETGFAAPIAYLVLLTAQTVAAIVVIRDGVTVFRDGTRLRRGPLTVLLVLTAATVVAALLVGPPTADLGWSGRGAALLLALACCLWALTPVLTSGVLAPLSLVLAVLAALAGLPDIEPTQFVVSIVSFSFIMVTITLSFRISVWMLGIVWEQERTRRLHARLAVAEERLRFSRDLHDVLGRALSAIALKSELGAELSRRGEAERAAAQMLEVRELAGDSLRDIRAVVAGYRTADLGAEIAGARSVLRSAGVRTRIIGEELDLPPGVQSALAWVVREGVTNVVRHASARTCTIDLAVEDDVAQLTIVNDDATAVPSSGSGLLGLSERLAGLGGTIETDLREGTFTLRARVPLTGADGEPAAAPETMDAP